MRTLSARYDFGHMSNIGSCNGMSIRFPLCARSGVDANKMLPLTLNSLCYQDLLAAEGNHRSGRTITMLKGNAVERTRMMGDGSASLTILFLYVSSLPLLL